MASMTRMPYLPIGLGFVLVALGALVRRGSARAALA
jgi:hypothetical protein